MGNSCCKERIDRANDSKNPVDRIIGRCAQICPNAMGRNNWNKHVLETRPPKQTQVNKTSTLTSWKNMTLSVPDGIDRTESKTNKDIAPIAPPRKKRRSSSYTEISIQNTLNNKNPNFIPNGFKDVFGNEERRFSRDSILLSLPNLETTNKTHDSYNVIQIRRQSHSSSNEDFTDFGNDKISKVSKNDTLTKNIVPKVGNRKTDKFFGENLSVCLSDERLNVDNDDKLDEFLQKNNILKEKEKIITRKVEEMHLSKSPPPHEPPKPPNPPKRKMSQGKDVPITEEFQIKSIQADTVEKEPETKQDKGKNSSLDRKAQFLMEMLNDEINIENQYSQLQPIEEPLMVQKRKVTKCPCCNNDEELKKHLHLHEKTHEEHEQNIIPPKKPSRDFNRYNSKNGENNENSESEKNVDPPQRIGRAKRNISSKDDLVPLKQENTNSLSTEPPNKITRNISMPDSLDNENIETLLKKCKSSNSFRADDLMDELIKTACNDFRALDSLFIHQNIDHYDDGSGAVSPSTKLPSKRNSFNRLNSLNINISGNEDQQPKTPTSENSCCSTSPTFSIGARQIDVNDKTQKKKKVSISDQKSPEIQITTPDLQITKPLEFQQNNTNMPPKPIGIPLLVENDSISIAKIDDAILNKLIASSDLNIESLSNVLDDLSKTTEPIAEEFQDYLNAESQKELSKNIYAKGNNLNSPNSENRSTIVEIKSVSTDFGIEDDKSIDTESDFESEKEDHPTNIRNLHLDELKYRRPRRDSIEDMDTWFSKHLDHNPMVTDVIHGTQKGRRGSEGMINYDTTRIFPFGKISRIRTDSETSSDFFENRHDSIPNLMNLDHKKPILKRRDTGDDHSSLLKIIQRESPKKE